MNETPKPIFSTVLGSEWNKLGSVVRKHYSLTPYSQDYVRVEGVMKKIHHSMFAKLLLPFGVLFGAIVPYRAKNVPATVHYTSRPDDALLYWDREFQIKPDKTFHFKSHMQHTKDNEVIEFVRFGVGLRLLVTAEEGALVFRGAGYIWKIMGYHIPIPAGLLFGKAYVEERPIDENMFSMKLHLKHPVFGTMFSYQGEFSIAN